VTTFISVCNLSYESHVLFASVFLEFSVVSVLNAKFRKCLSDCKQLNTPGLLQKAGVDPGSTNITADKILYNHAIQMVKSFKPVLLRNNFVMQFDN
jgi:hypothetical protein